MSVDLGPPVVRDLSRCSIRGVLAPDGGDHARACGQERSWRSVGVRERHAALVKACTLLDELRITMSTDTSEQRIGRCSVTTGVHDHGTACDARACAIRSRPAFSRGNAAVSRASRQGRAWDASGAATAVAGDGHPAIYAFITRGPRPSPINTSLRSRR